MLKRFMTWLLRQFQRAIGALTGRQKRSHMADADEIVQSAEEIASRPYLESAAAPDHFAALPVQTLAALADTTADTGHSALLEPDTHRRLDAAPASLTSDLPASHGFAVDISDLISAQSSQLSASQPVPTEAAFDSSPATDSPPAVDEQFPEIHDLLPALEPEEDEPEEMVSDQAVLFSFDIIESVVTIQPLPQAVNELEPNDEPADEPADELPVDESLAFSEETVPEETALEETVPEESEIAEAEVPEEAIAEAEIAEDPDLDEKVLEAASPEIASPEAASLESPAASETTNSTFNPWTAATPSPQQPSPQQPSPDQLSTKTGVVKLLFKLNPGNFHGYIAPEDGTPDILFHQKYINADIFAQLDRGSRVVTIVKQLEGKAYATRIDLLQE